MIQVVDNALQRALQSRKTEMYQLSWFFEDATYPKLDGENPRSCNCCLEREVPVLQMNIFFCHHCHSQSQQHRAYFQIIYVLILKTFKTTSSVSSIRGLPSCWEEKRHVSPRPAECFVDPSTAYLRGRRERG